MTELLYCAVIRNRIIIAAYGDRNSVSENDIIKLLPNSNKTEQKITGGNVFSFLSTPGLTFASVGPQNSDKQRQLVFLDTLSRRWATSYGQISNNATMHSLDQVLANNFSQLFNEFSQPPNKTAEINRRLDETQQILSQSVSKALIRGGELSSLSAKSEEMMATSEEFRTQSANLHWKMRCSYIKSWALYIFLGILLFYFVLSRFCGGYKLSKCT